MYAIYGNIYHQYTPFMLAYIPYMDPMGYIYIYLYIVTAIITVDVQRGLKCGVNFREAV